MNKSKLSPYTKVLLLVCVLLIVMACGGVEEPRYKYIVIVVTATPPAESFNGLITDSTPTPLYESAKHLDVAWSFDSIKCTAAGKLKEATVRLIISGGQPPYEISPSSPFSISDGNVVKITVESQGAEPFEAYVPPPTCDKESVNDPGEGDQPSPGGGSTSPPGGGVPTATLNPTFHP